MQRQAGEAVCFVPRQNVLGQLKQMQQLRRSGVLAQSQVRSRSKEKALNGTLDFSLREVKVLRDRGEYSAEKINIIAGERSITPEKKTRNQAGDMTESKSAQDFSLFLTRIPPKSTKQDLPRGHESGVATPAHDLSSILMPPSAGSKLIDSKRKSTQVVCYFTDYLGPAGE